LAALLPRFDVIAADIPEPLGRDPIADALAHAAAKARAVSERLSTPAAVIGADTVVFLGNKSYGKPGDAADALRMWDELGGREHAVVTGFAVSFAGETQVGHAVSRVTLTRPDAGVLIGYVQSRRPLDKAGAYAIQDDDVPTVARLEGCYCNVVGLPLWGLRPLLLAAGVQAARPDKARAVCANCPARPAR
jgi:septum formation protein